MNNLENIGRPLRIKDRSNAQRWVNHFNMLKLTGVGSAISSVLEFAIEQLVEENPGLRPLEMGPSIDITVYSKTVSSHPEAHVLIRRQWHSKLTQKGAPHILGDYPGVFYLAPDGRAVVISTFPSLGPSMFS